MIGVYLSGGDCPCQQRVMSEGIVSQGDCRLNSVCLQLLVRQILLQHLIECQSE